MPTLRLSVLCTTASLALAACATLDAPDVSLVPPAPVPVLAAAPPPPVPLRAAPPVLIPSSSLATARVATPRFDVVVNDVPASQFFLSLLAGSGRNLVAPPDLQTRISLNLKAVSLEETLAAVRDAYGYDYERTPYGYRILAPTLQTRIFTLDYLSVERSGVSKTRVNGSDMQSKVSGSNGGNGSNGYSGSNNGQGEEGAGIRLETRTSSRFWADLEGSLKQVIGNGERRSLSLNPQAGVIVVTASRSELDTVASYLGTLQGSLSRQVVLEAKILEVTLSDGYQSGINWTALAQPARNASVVLGQTGGGGLVGNGGSNGGATGNLNPLAAAFPDFARIASFGGMFSAAVSLGDFAAFVELLETQGKVRVLSSPRIATLNNQKAVIKIGADEFFVTDIASTSISSGAGVTTSPSVSLTPFFSGIALDVTPQISATGMVTLHVHPTISEVHEQLKQIPLGTQTREVPLAASSIREADSVVRAQSGQVIVIGGLMQDSSEDRSANVPGLVNLPLVGQLFAQKRQSHTKKELVILLRPQVVADGDAPDASAQRLQSQFAGAQP